MDDDLPDKREFFCREYLVDFNATQAAIRAGYSAATAGSIGHTLLKIVEVQKRLDALKAERAAAAGITAERVLQEIARLALSDSRDVVKFTRKRGRDGRKLKSMEVVIADFDDLTPDQAAQIAGVVQTKGKAPKIEVKIHDKVKALEMLAKHVGIFKDNGDAPNVTVVNLTPNFGERKIEPKPAAVDAGATKESKEDGSAEA